MKSSALRLSVLGLVLASLAGCGVLGNKADPNAPSRSNSFQEEQERVNSRKQDAPTKIDSARVASSNLGLAATYYSYGRYTTAQDVIVRSLEVDPNNAAAWSLAGSISFELKDLPKARENFAKSLALGGDDPDVLHNYGTFLCRSGSEVEGIAYLDRALAIATYTRPSSSEAGAGGCLMKLGRHDEARGRFGNALMSDPMNPQALLGSAQLALKAREPQRARELLSRYQQMAPVTASSLWLAVQIGQLANNKHDVMMAAKDLRNNYPDSPEVKMLNNLPPLQ